MFLLFSFAFRRRFPHDGDVLFAAARLLRCLLQAPLEEPTQHVEDALVRLEGFAEAIRARWPWRVVRMAAVRVAERGFSLDLGGDFRRFLRDLQRFREALRGFG